MGQQWAEGMLKAAGKAISFGSCSHRNSIWCPISRLLRSVLHEDESRLGSQSALSQQFCSARFCRLLHKAAQPHSGAAVCQQVMLLVLFCSVFTQVWTHSDMHLIRACLNVTYRILFVLQGRQCIPFMCLPVLSLAVCL